VCECAEIEALGPPEVPLPRHQSEGEQDFLRLLVRKHGSDYAAMARDLKLNRYQQTAAELRRRLVKMQRDGAKG
jgi:nucleolar protein 16